MTIYSFGGHLNSQYTTERERERERERETKLSKIALTITKNQPRTDSLPSLGLRLKIFTLRWRWRGSPTAGRRAGRRWPDADGRIGRVPMAGLITPRKQNNKSWVEKIIKTFERTSKRRWKNFKSLTLNVSSRKQFFRLRMSFTVGNAVLAFSLTAVGSTVFWFRVIFSRVRAVVVAAATFHLHSSLEKREHLTETSSLSELDACSWVLASWVV